MERSVGGGSCRHSLFSSTDSSYSLRSLRARNAENDQSFPFQPRKGKTLRKYRSMYPLRKISNTNVNESRLSLHSVSGHLPSPPSSDEESVPTPPSKYHSRVASKNLPTPPLTDDEEENVTRRVQQRVPRAREYSFPLQPVSLPSTRENMQPQTPGRRYFSARNRKKTTSPFLDRFISNRSTPTTPQSPADTYRLSKDVGQLTPEEKSRRHQSATPDPFGPLKISRIRADRVRNSIETGFTQQRSHSRTIGFATVSEVTMGTTMIQSRQVSPGNVLTVGGSVILDSSSPTHGVSNGLGGFLSSGSNAPMHESRFLDDLSTDQDVDQIEQRLAAALDIDQTTRILENSKPYADSRCVSTGSIGIKRKRLYLEQKTTWKDGQWVQEGHSEGRIIFPYSNQRHTDTPDDSLADIASSHQKSPPLGTKTYSNSTLPIS